MVGHHNQLIEEHAREALWKRPPGYRHHLPRGREPDATVISLPKQTPSALSADRHEEATVAVVEARKAQSLPAVNQLVLHRQASPSAAASTGVRSRIESAPVKHISVQNEQPMQRAGSVSGTLSGLSVIARYGQRAQLPQ